MTDAVFEMDRKFLVLVVSPWGVLVLCTVIYMWLPDWLEAWRSSQKKLVK